MLSRCVSSFMPILRIIYVPSLFSPLKLSMSFSIEKEGVSVPNN